MISFLSIIVLALGAGEGAGDERLTRPSLVALDFRDRPVSEVVKAIGERSGDALELRQLGAPPGLEPRITLEAPEPVPFWEAVDRLCAAAHLPRNVSEGGQFGSPRAQVQLSGPSGGRHRDDGPARYVGPLRLGEFSLHARRDLVFIPGPTPMAANDPGPLYAEFRVQVEPRFVAYQAGPLARLEAEDETGRPLLDPGRAGRDAHRDPARYALDWVRIPLARPPEPGTTLKRLRGVIPVEIGVRSHEPTLVIPLAGAAGKTFRAGDVAFVFRESVVNRQGTAQVRLTVRLEGERNDPSKVPDGLLGARAMALFHRQLEIVDDEGRPMMATSGGSNLRRNELDLNYTISSSPPGPKPRPPTRFRYYALESTTWEAPFAFEDVPLP